MKVLIVSSSFYPKIDGSTRCVYDHGRKLAEENIVYLETRGLPGSPKRQDLEGMHIIRSSVAYRSSSVVSKAMLLFDQMLQIILLQRTEKFDVIHAHGYVSGLAGIPARYLCRVPLIITTHGTELLWPRQLWWKSTTEVKLSLIFEKFVLNHCDIVIAQSQGVKEYMMEIYGKGIEGKIRLVHTGVDHVKFNVAPLTRPLRKVLFVGALSEIKGVTCLLRAFDKVHQGIPDSRLALVGSGPNFRHYKKLISEMGLDGSVEFYGAIRDDKKLIELYGESDIVVLPSNVGGPVSCTIMEGLSCGRAVISTDVPGGIPDVLGNGVGFLMKKGDEVQLASYLSRLMTDEDLLRAISSGARRTVEERYTLDSMVDKLRGIYEVLAA